MSNYFLAGQTIVRSIDLKDETGADINASAITYRVLDQDGLVLVGPTLVTPWTEGVYVVPVTVASGNNTLSGGKKRGLRSIELTLTTADGLRILVDSYIIEELDPLAIPTNSFQSMGAAELLAAELPNLTAWDAASRPNRIKALIQARLHISELSFRFTFSDWMSHVEPEFGVGDLKLLTLEEFDALSTEFKEALYRAQVYEADDILDSVGTSLNAKRKAGILSETIGESSMMFKSSGGLRMPVCERAMRMLSKYVERRIRIGRA